MAAMRRVALHSNPSASLPRFPDYSFASRIQTVLQQELLAWKACPPSSRGPPPPPSVVCFTPTPTYTLGRRQTEPLPEIEVSRLRSPLFVRTPSENGKWIGDDTADPPKKPAYFLPAITHVPRGGLTTYHGPGQLVIWPVIDLHSPLHAHLSVRDYACLLEKTTIATLESMWGLNVFTTENPGVWTRSRSSEREGAGEEGGEDARKIAALGVHLRRHVTGLGVAINYSTPVTGPAEINPWARIVACGLGDRRVTSVCAELGTSSWIDQTNSDQEVLQILGKIWRLEFRKRLKMHEDADNMIAAFDFDQSSENLKAQVNNKDDVLVEAYPIGNLKGFAN